MCTVTHAHTLVFPVDSFGYGSHVISVDCELALTHTHTCTVAHTHTLVFPVDSFGYGSHVISVTVDCELARTHAHVHSGTRTYTRVSNEGFWLRFSRHFSDSWLWTRSNTHTHTCTVARTQQWHMNAHIHTRTHLDTRLLKLRYSPTLQMHIWTKVVLIKGNWHPNKWKSWNPLAYMGKTASILSQANQSSDGSRS